MSAEHRAEARLMGSRFTFGVVDEDDNQAHAALEAGIAEVQRLEALLSEFLPESDCARINQAAGLAPVPVSAECFALLTRCQAISELTQGTFDVTVGPLKRLYNFKNEVFVPPDATRIREVRQLVGYRNIELDPARRTVRLPRPGMRVSFAAIGKGYASDAVRRLWQAMGIEGGYVNASGDLAAFGRRPTGEPWRIGIANPDAPDKMLLHLDLSDACVATSGDYEQHFWHQGTRYSHNISPHTGLPLTGVKSVTVLSPSAELSDALATAVYVMGPGAGISFIRPLPQTEALIIDEHNRIHVSEGLRYVAV